jgi:hypothetical protein
VASHFSARASRRHDNGCLQGRHQSLDRDVGQPRPAAGLTHLPKLVELADATLGTLLIHSPKHSWLHNF